ncbi:fibronectin type III domain-containing protein, partial [Agathobacter ruminis]
MTATADVSCDNWQYSLDGGSTWKTFASSGKSNAFTISNLSGGKKYTVVARARKTDNNVFSEQSKSVSATTKPNPPGNLSVSAVKKDSAKLSWNNTTGATSYNVYLNDKVIEKNVQGTSYTFSGLIPNSAYTFGVSATGTSGDSSLAKTAEYVTLASAPTKVKVQSQNQDSVKLSWSQSTDGNEATITYNIYRDDKLIGTSSTNSYTDTVYNNTDCKYAVCAVTSAGNSAKSSAVSVKHVPLSINAEATNKSYYTIITPTYKGGVNREIDPTSCKWAYGNKEISDFENGGYAFSTSFAVTKNGTYTVYAQDVDGNEAVGIITVSDIYTIDTIGAFTENDTDLYVESIGLPVSFERTYNSMSEDDIFGKGWSFNYAKKTVLNEAGTVRIVYLPDGSINYFTVNDDGIFSGIKTQNTLTVANDIYEVTTKDNYKYIYENETLTTIQDANGNKIIIDLNAKQLPEKITDSADRTYTIEYDESGHITTITDPANRCVSYAYDNGMLTSVTALTQEVSETYEYTDGLLTVVKDASGKVTSQLIYNDQKQVDKLTNEEGDETYYYYHITRNGEVVVYEDDAEIIIDEMDSDSNPASNIYNTFGQLIVSADGYLYEYNQDGTISKVDGTNSDKTLVVYSYDDYGNVTKIITKSADEQTLEEEKYTYTYHDGTSAIASEEITTTSYNYDKSGECESTETKTSSYSFDKCGNVLSEQEDTQSEDAISYSYDEKGLVLTKTDSSTTVEYTYDANGYISTEEVSEDGKETTKETSYNVIGNLLSTTEGGLTTEYLYDLAGNEIRIKQNDGDTVLVSRYIYNRNHKVIQAIGADNYSESDDLLNPDENGLCQENIYEDSNAGERYTYDEDGNVLTYINAANNQTVNTYDADGNLVKTVTYESCDTTKDGLTTRYVYDSEGRLTQTIYPHQYQASKDQLDVENGINEYDDDSVGERASYDEDGNVIAQTNSFGEETTNLYDANGKLVKSTTGKKVIRFVYDGGENLLQVIYPDQYDEEDDKLDLEADEPIDQYANADVGDRYEYDSDGNIIKYTNSYGIVSENTYEDGKLIKVSRSDGTEFSYNKSGEATKETYANGLTNEISHTEDQTIITGSNGLTTTYQKNGFGEITSYHLETDNLDQDYTYTYDAKGNILSVSLNDNLLQSYSYNASDELIRVNDQVADETVTYQYDYVGNITEVATYAYTEGSLGDAITTEVYTYDTNNRRTDLTYDDDGNLTQFNGYELSWTDRRLKSATSSDHDISYTYNYAGIRTSKTV